MVTALTVPAGAAQRFVPLPTWMDSEAEKEESLSDENDEHEKRRKKKESIIRKTTVAYGIVELLKRSKKLDDEEIRVDNFLISVSKNVNPSQRSWADIDSVGMLSSGMWLMIEEPPYLNAMLRGEACGDRILGRFLAVEMKSATQENVAKPAEAKAAPKNGLNDYHMAAMNALAAVAEESNRCHLFARLLYELFTHEHEPFPDDAASTKEPAKKRLRSYNEYLMLPPEVASDEGVFEMDTIPFQTPSIVRMQKLGIPASICFMTQNLLEYSLRGNGGQSDDAYESLGVVSEDLHLLLLDPNRFLFDNDNQNTDNMKLLYREGKLYGRHKEETLITEAFCRISPGKSEAFFVSGFSGSGKSMLVNCLSDKVNAVGGYVIKHKFDVLCLCPLSGVISAFNKLCLMIKGGDRPVIAKKLMEEFGAGVGLLIRLLPNVSALFPELVSSAIKVGAGDVMNARSVSFTLLRFMRVVTSPVMLFLDDIQWADSTALDVIHTILSDKLNSCMFFVGTYRDNEVQVDHDIFNLMRELETSHVHTTKLSLAGLDQSDLNTMISDALCLYPRICKSLTEIVFQKTKGNPFFVLEFMQSLQSRGLLRYNSLQKRWVWNEDVIRGEEITENVLHLLSSKMNGLSDNVQTLLRVMACYGVKIHALVIGYLSETKEYSGIRNGLEEALGGGFIVKDEEGYFQFVHDKVHEAAYNLISRSERKQFHYHLGKVLYSFCDGKDAEDTIFLIASQINHGKEWILRDNELRIGIAELNMKAGKKALDGCDHETAYSFLCAALSLLPKDHWENHYDLSLRLGFLIASAANSTCHYDKAIMMLRKIIEKAHCLEDQLPSYILLSQTLHAQGKLNDVYDTCSAILTELGESIPESYNLSMATKVIDETLKMYDEAGEEWLKSDATVDKTLHNTLQLYRAITFASLFCKSHSMVVYFASKAVQLSLSRGICEHTPLSLLQFTSVAIKDDNAMMCYRMAKNALSLRERFDLANQIPELYMNFYGRVAWRFEPFQAGVHKLRQCLDAGLSSGRSDIGLFCGLNEIKYALCSGANLKSLLKRIDYYLHLMETYTYRNEATKNNVLLIRETVSFLIDNGQATSIEASACVGDLNDPKNKLREAFIYYSAIRCFWLGHNGRCRYYGKKCIDLFWQGGQATSYVAKFYLGLNSLGLISTKREVRMNKEVAREAIAAMKDAADHSGWNFSNKFRLLQAEDLSLNKRYDPATVLSLYEGSIESARKSGFIHEQGLACEKAGNYCKDVLKMEKALEYLNQARECYEKWGSDVRVAFIKKELDALKG